MATGSTSAQRGGIGGGVFLVGLGMLLLTGWWWPGILVVIGTAIAADRLLEGHLTSAVIVLAIFVGIPLGIAILSSIDIPWTGLIACVLIVLGGATVVRTVLARAR